jgi:hypothetical protein
MCLDGHSEFTSRHIRLLRSAHNLRVMLIGSDNITTFPRPDMLGSDRSLSLEPSAIHASNHHFVTPLTSPKKKVLSHLP